MTSYVEISSLKALKNWIQTESQRATNWFGCPSPGRSKCLLISDQPWCDIQWDSHATVRRTLFPLELPSLDDAGEWWWKIWEGKISVHLYYPFESIAVLAKQAVWQAIPEWYLLRSKNDFIEVEHEPFKTAVGAELYSRMIGEKNACGISTRMCDGDLQRRLNRLAENHE